MVFKVLLYQNLINQLIFKTLFCTSKNHYAILRCTQTRKTMHHNSAFSQIDIAFNQNFNTYLSTDCGIHLAKLGLYMSSDLLKVLFLSLDYFLPFITSAVSYTLLFLMLQIFKD